MLSDAREAEEKAREAERLNPCSNGICSLTNKKKMTTDDWKDSLNPCSNGICSLTT